MSISQVSAPTQTLQCKPVPGSKDLVLCQKSDTAAPNLPKDELKIAKGLLPTVKGLAGGGLTAAATGAGISAFLSHNMVGIFGDMTTGGAASVGVILGGIVGGVTGAVVANVTDSKTTGAIAGAVVGGVVGMLSGTGYLMAGVAGAAGGAVAASLAQRK